MELKILFIVVLFLGACAGFSLPEEQENYEDAPSEEEVQELEEMNNDGAETDLEDPMKVRRPFRCPKSWRRKCFFVKHCYRRILICRCFPPKRYDEDETEFDDQLNDAEMIETPEDEAEQFDETNQELEDPSKDTEKGDCVFVPVFDVAVIVETRLKTTIRRSFSIDMTDTTTGHPMML
ncbi:hypothetical protein OS493_033615 [Desmophyllum pertusum]|uniref:Uncharacterized protein n=1 Tax=Desmophyllum pertusum TaxID=174260 RepID=A0A9W9YIV1_9CNID|nr:hypothetical protein OS493_033615 [Desmophyllum pertusum]